MKTKNLKKSIFTLFLLLGALWWSSCIGDDCRDCPCEPEDARVHYTYLDTQYKEYLPYYNLDTLVYDVTYEGKYYGEVTFVKTFQGPQYYTEFDVIGACDSFYDEYHLIRYHSDKYPFDFKVFNEGTGFFVELDPFPRFEVRPVVFVNSSFGFATILDSININNRTYYDCYFEDIDKDSSKLTYFNAKYGYLNMINKIDNIQFKLIRAL
jgi:hypothetical protein